MKPKQLYYGLLGALAVLIVAGLGGYYLAHTSLQESIIQVQQRNADIVIAREHLQNLRELERSYQALEPLEDKTQRILPQDKHQSEVAAQIFAMIESSGLQGSGISFDSTSGLPSQQTQTTVSSVSGVRVMPANFNVQGTYEQLLDFLGKIERQERLMQVTSLDIRRIQDSNNLTFGIQLEVFLKP